MPVYFQSQTFRDINILERLADPKESEDQVKQKLFLNNSTEKPFHLEVLRPGNTYLGQQMSASHKYRVTVQFQDVNLNESFVCGYLTIEGLTDEYPSLTTFFEGEVIGRKHRFQTRKWDATHEIDMEHWGKFEPWVRKYLRFMNEDQITANPFEDEHIYMRWKEKFLVPDHRVTQVNGASYSGFYYTCMEVATGSINGYYFHNNSEKFQQIVLECDRAYCTSSFEYR